ncbi:iron-siderophore ABC transporter substrate-binding protein [Nocardioides zeae]|nr:iron-siderophore ABC transporter substrate-binding protein [Nocardioides zeae]
MKKATLLLAALTSALAPIAVGCGASDAPDSGSGTVVEHVFGVTEVPDDPQRVVTLGWGSTEAALAVGVVPVAIPNGEGNGGIDDGLHPWVAEFLSDEGLDAPELLSANAGAEPPFEEIASYDPDLILAVEAGLTDTQYERLSEIAPTVAHPGEAWATPWREVITITGDALGEPDRAADVLAQVDAKTEAARRAHPEFAGRSITASAIYDDEFYIFTGSEPRSLLLAQLGFEVESFGQTEPWYELSFEHAGQITSDVLLLYFQTEDEARAFEASAPARLLTQYREGRVATVIGGANVAAVSPPTALSWEWTLDDFTDELSRAAAH